MVTLLSIANTMAMCLTSMLPPTRLLIKRASPILISNAGLHFRHVNEDKFAVSGGLGMQHLNKPEQNFFSDKVTLFPRYALDLNLGIKASERIYVLPSVLYQMQGKFTELNGGANIKLALSKKRKK